MNRIGLALGCLVAAAAVAGSPALAAKKATHQVSCKEIKDAMASGKTADEVAKDLNTSASRVKTCTTPSTKHHKATHKAS